MIILFTVSCTNYKSQSICPCVGLNELICSYLLHLQLSCVDVWQSCLQTCQQLLPLLDCFLQLLPSLFTLLLQLLQTSCLQLSCTLLPRQTVYQDLAITWQSRWTSLPFNGKHTSISLPVLAIIWANSWVWSVLSTALWWPLLLLPYPDSGDGWEVCWRIPILLHKLSAC